MEYNYTDTQNLAALRRCERLYKWVFFFYACTCFPYILISLIFGIFGLGNTYIVIFNGIIMNLIIAALGILGCYTKKDLLCILAPAAAGCSLAISYNFFNCVILVGAIACAVFSVIANKKYRELETLEGFPYFNERIDAANEAFRSGRDEYKERYEALKNRNLSSDMDDLASDSADMPHAEKIHRDYMDDI